MIPVSSLQYGVLQQANHTDSEYLNNLSVPQIDYYLNRGKDIIVEWLAAQDETNDTVRRYLAQIVKRDVELKSTLSGTKCIANYPEDFYKQKSLYGIATLGTCLPRRIKIRRPSSEKFQSAIKNSNANKVWDFEQTFAIEADNGLHVFTEEGVEIKVFLDYIRKVKDVAYPSGAKHGSYINHDGKPVTVDVNLDLDSPFFYSTIVNLAVLEIKKDYSNLQDYQAQKDFILTIARI